MKVMLHRNRRRNCEVANDVLGSLPARQLNRANQTDCFASVARNAGPGVIVLFHGALPYPGLCPKCISICS